MTTGVAGVGVTADMTIEDVVMMGGAMMDGATIGNGQTIKKRRMKHRFFIAQGIYSLDKSAKGCRPSQTL